MAVSKTPAKIVMVGMGPGALEYLPPLGMAKIKTADILVGGRRHLEHFAHLPVAKKEITGDLAQLRNFLQENYQHQKIVILVSGDPGFHSILTYLTRYFPRDIFEVIPGISSLQLAFAKLALPWQDASLLSLHGKELSLLQKYLAKGLLGLLTDGINTPQAIARVYLEAGMLDKVIYTCENLSYPDEKIQRFQVAELCEEPRKFNNCVVIVCDAER